MMFGRFLTWRSRLTIVTRLVLNVALAMTIVLALSSGLVYVRVQYALDRQLNRDLRAYYDLIEEDVESGNEASEEIIAQWYQVFDGNGTLLFGTPSTPGRRLINANAVTEALGGKTVHSDRGSFLPPPPYAFRAKASRTTSRDGKVVVVAVAVSRTPRDEALRELLLQLIFADILLLAAVSYVGYRTARGALDPVERYRLAAMDAGARAGSRLPVDSNRDDELTRLGHSLNEQLARLEASFEREHLFIADASHELRTPLALLKAEVELALLKPRTAEYTHTVLGSVGEQVDRLIVLADALLDLEELGTGEDTAPTPVDVPALLSTVSEPFEQALARKDLHLVVHAEPMTATLSERCMHVAVSNLIANSLRYGAGTVTVSAVRLDGRLVVGVTDQGKGFADDFSALAFDRFTRADASRSTRGSGLGLSLVMAVAERHGGTSRIDQSSEGVSVVMDLPFVNGTD